MVNNLVQKINLRKRRDTIIVGVVIGVCLAFLLWYALA
jgi:Golgi SNAP receptor complex protein 1